MLDRHIPRLCHECGAPMSRQTDDCWKCGVPWTAAPADAPPPTLSVVPPPAEPAAAV